MDIDRNYNNIANNKNNLTFLNTLDKTEEESFEFYHGVLRNLLEEKDFYKLIDGLLFFMDKVDTLKKINRFTPHIEGFFVLFSSLITRGLRDYAYSKDQHLLEKNLQEAIYITLEELIFKVSQGKKM